ncbi:MAG: hypothetical protein H6702_09525 [Myxococcales bacterium]|nr:hypothetical protein [Myxococcales bacterium]
MTDPWLERLREPPRGVPLRLALVLRFGGTGALIGWVFLAFALAFVAGVASFANYSEALQLQFGTLKATPGVMLGWSETNTTVNEEPVIANHARFSAEGREHECTSYAVGEGLAPDEPVMVEHLAGQPHICRIVGMDASTVPWWVMLILAPFLIIGGVFAFLGYRSGGRTVRLLRHGRAGYGQVVGRRDTGVRINEDIQWEVTVEFTDDRGRAHRATTRTLDLDEVTDDPQEGLLYLPERPESMLLVDALPDAVDNDAQGRWLAPGLGATLLRLLAPGFCALMVTITVAVF